MKVSQKSLAPGGISTVRIYLAVGNVDKQIDFIQSTFDASINEQLKNPEGFTMHGELQIGDSIIMVGRATAEVKPIQGMSYVYVANVDDVYTRAIQNGAVSLAAPADQVYGNREGGFRDAEGNVWWVAQFMKEVSSEEIEMDIKKKGLV